MSEPDQDQLLNAAVGVEAIMASNYDRAQAAEMCLAAWHDPEIPVTFDAQGGKRGTVIFVPQFGWGVYEQGEHQPAPGESSSGSGEDHPGTDPARSGLAG